MEVAVIASGFSDNELRVGELEGIKREYYFGVGFGVVDILIKFLFGDKGIGIKKCSACRRARLKNSASSSNASKVLQSSTISSVGMLFSFACANKHRPGVHIYIMPLARLREMTILKSVSIHKQQLSLL